MATAHAAQGPLAMPEPAENLSRLVQSIRVQARDGVSNATLRLNPEHLGELTVTIRVEAGTVSAVVRAESGDVRQWLRGQEGSIRAALAEQGLHLDELVVEQDGERPQDGGQEQEQQPRRHRVRMPSGVASSFEVTA
jgi:flagellar hook-length control protein FliK